MTFRIRKLGDDTSWEEGEKAYLDHLKQFSKSSKDALWKYFCSDFFHDGTVDFCEIRPDLKTVVVGLNGPNIKHLQVDGEFEYLSADFTCTFENVVALHIEEDPPTQVHDPGEAYAVFLCAEINTSPLLETSVASEQEDCFSSILIELLAHDSVIWMEIVFSYVSVEPKEPVAFSLMEASPEFDVPTWSPDDR